MNGSSGNQQRKVTGMGREIPRGLDVNSCPEAWKKERNYVVGVIVFRLLYVNIFIFLPLLLSCGASFEQGHIQ